MKPLCFVLLMFSSYCFAQKPDIFRIDSIPQKGILLDKGWKWHAGDNPDYAKADFDDSAWESIDPTKDIMSLPQIWKTEVVWFRLRFNADSSLINKSLVMQVNQTGASEIFLNGQLIEKFGKINTKTHQIQAATPINGSFIGLPIRKIGEQVLTVRFAIQKNISFIRPATGQPIAALALQVMETSATSLVIENNIEQYFIFLRVGLFLILSILHFALFWFNKSQKANLYFFQYALLFAISTFLAGLIVTQVHFASTKIIFGFTFIILSNVGIIFFLTAVYSVFNRQRSFIYWILFVYSLVSFILLFVNSQNGYNLGNIAQILIPLESVRVTFIAKREKRRGANIILAGAVSFLVFITLWILLLSGYLPAGPKLIYRHLAYSISALSIPIAISIYLALESAFTSKSLKLKLVEVEALSAEKQQILATQNETLERQVAERTAELQASQNQLIQSEKLASLGELTAGKAHEIQNPLNFVNNFAELSVDLAKELKEEAEKPEIDKELILDLATDLSQNQEKIHHHGIRASNIVKGMLEHSRKSAGEKELTDINTLADEYLRLAYHGLRAKDKNFNSDFKTDFDPDLPKIVIIPQDIGRVLLNLINNAFYATKGVKNPVVEIKIERVENGVIVTVKDNGLGMSEEVRAKIFQPFFTTKPTGQGTGLGLSLSYDIVKVHRGELKVETSEGEGSKFIIQLPF